MNLQEQYNLKPGQYANEIASISVFSDTKQLLREVGCKVIKTVKENNKPVNYLKF